MSSLFWYGFAAGVATVVAALMFAALVSRWFREPASHRAGIDEDEDDPEPLGPKPTWRPGMSGQVEPRVAVQPPTTPKVHIDGSLFATPADAAAYWASNDARPGGLGPPPTYPETSRLLPGPPSGGRRDEELAGGDARNSHAPSRREPPAPIAPVCGKPGIERKRDGWLPTTS
jgi:hypothetical protein